MYLRILPVIFGSQIGLHFVFPSFSNSVLSCALCPVKIGTSDYSNIVKHKRGCSAGLTGPEISSSLAYDCR